MRHRKRGRKLNRTPAHRKALLRSLANSLFMTEKNRIVTTVAKAKEVRPFAEKLITLAKDKSLHRYRRALSILGDEASVNRLFNEIAPRYADRPGGYTRIIRWPKNRLGDNAPQAILELVTDEEAEAPEKRKRRGKRLSVKRKAKKEAAEATAAPKAAVTVEEAPPAPDEEASVKADESSEAVEAESSEEDETTDKSEA